LGRAHRNKRSHDNPNLPGEMPTTIALKKVSVGTGWNMVQEEIPEAIPRAAG
jgi:hypothetical protein